MLKIVNMCVSNPSKDKFLFLKRNKSPFKDYFGMLGGKIKEGEEPCDAACRELLEESGIIDKGRFLGKCHEKIINDMGIVAELEIYFFHFVVDENVEFNSSSEGELKWISINEFKNNKLIPSDPLMIDAFFNKRLKEVKSVIEEKDEEYSQKEFDECIIEKVRKFVLGVCDGLEHGDEWYNNHFSSVVKYSKILGEKNNADLGKTTLNSIVFPSSPNPNIESLQGFVDLEVLRIAAWLHDIGSILDGREDHHITGAKIAEDKLREFNYPGEKIQKVKHCILAHRGSKDIKRETIEAEILADADSMSHFDELGGLFKYEFIIGGINFKQREAQKRVREKLARSYNKLSDSAKKIIQPRYEAAMLLLEENGGEKENKNEFKENRDFIHIAKNLNERKKVVFTAQSCKNFHLRMLICKHAFEQGVVPVNPFNTFGYYLYELVDRNLVRNGNNNLMERCDELWVYGEISDGVLAEIQMFEKWRRPIRFFDISNPKLIKEISNNELVFENNVKNYANVLINIDNPLNKVTSKRGFSIYPTPTKCDTIKGIGYNKEYKNGFSS